MEASRSVDKVCFSKPIFASNLEDSELPSISLDGRTYGLVYDVLSMALLAASLQRLSGQVLSNPTSL